MFSLPTELDGHRIADRGDYRTVLKAVCALSDPDLNESGMFGNERALVALELFYEDFSQIVDYEKAIKNMFWFIDCGKEQSKSNKRPLYDWEQDSLLIAGAISEVAGFPIMEHEYLHWWSFISYFFQVGEGAFSTVCSIRSKTQKGKKLEKHEREFMRDNPSMVTLKTKLSDEEQGLIDDLFG